MGETEIVLKQCFLTIDNLKGVLHEKLMKTSLLAMGFCLLYEGLCFHWKKMLRYTDRGGDNVESRYTK